MRKYFAVLMCCRVTTACLGQVPLTLTGTSTENINTLSVSSGTQTYMATKIVAPSVPTNDFVGYAANVNFIGVQSIDLKPNFSAISFNSAGSFTATIGFLPCIMSKGPYYKYQKFELGLAFSSTFPPLSYVYNYITTASANMLNATNLVVNTNPSSPGNWGTMLNPYDPSQVLVTAVFTSPTNNTYTRYGFFYQDISTDADGYGYTITNDRYPFRIRFAPPVAGNWSVAISFYYLINGVAQTIGPITGVFTVADDNNHGFVQAGTKNPHYFQYSDGTNFFPIGQDINEADEENPQPGDFCYGCGIPPPSSMSFNRMLLLMWEIKEGTLPECG